MNNQELIKLLNTKPKTKTNFLCLGASHLDEIIRLEHLTERAKSNPAKVETIKAGGVANNIAINLAKLNNKVTMISPLPNEKILKYYKQLKIKHINLGINNVDGKYIGVLAKNGELKYGYALMSSYDLVTKKMLSNKLPKTKNNVLIVDANYSQTAIKHAFKLAKNYSWISIANGTSVVKVNKLKNIKWDVLIVNYLEACELVGKASITTLLNKLTNMTKGIVIITNGDKGAYLGSKEEIIHQKPPKVKVINESGAGDVFCAVFSSCLINKLSVDDSLKLSVTYASNYVSVRNS